MDNKKCSDAMSMMKKAMAMMEEGMSGYESEESSEMASMGEEDSGGMDEKKKTVIALMSKKGMGA